VAVDRDDALRAAALAYVGDLIERSGGLARRKELEACLRSDYVVEIKPNVLAAHDGPTLQHALQGLHGEVIGLPRKRAQQPSRELLEERYERFRAAG
jgi:hypothetical protein